MFLNFHDGIYNCQQYKDNMYKDSYFEQKFKRSIPFYSIKIYLNAFLTI